ncbi:kinesin-like protein KIF16B isoform X1 [Bufo gargarizans]|uniref:kinesin-like protein KIF16B isoform X1 n=1 Tax=Bufo gargarizans TaxID=30331 RepID=UPI001CF2ED03|nr:kinesin-like protein KIF16B isoform X1 [Bufo gargarizans]
MASVKVAVRVRPMNRREKDLEAKFIIEIEGKKTAITNIKLPDGITGDSSRDRTKVFTYDFSFFSADCKNSNYVSQERVFRDLGTDVLKSAFEGYNACVFAYGQTGSGKSYTMMGNTGDSGLIPRICEGLFSRIADATRKGDASFRTEVSYLEIYNERVRDLLRRKSSKTFNLRVREHPKEGPYVEDLSKHLVQNYSDVEELMDAGNINRTTAATGMNDVSSRSHAIFTINFTQAKFDAEMPCETVSKIHLVDLAGSERADATGATGVRLKEGGNINKSLVTLGNVISALADLSQDAASHLVKKKQVFVPYRDSVLTWLLKDSLGGNSKTIMIATISPADINYGETLSTLRYANRAKNIINKPTINEDANVRLIRELRAEIARLKALLAQGNQIALLDSPTALSMEEKLQQNEARVEELTKEWTNKWNETQNILREQTLALRKEGIGVVLDSELPHLIGIDDDLLSTGIILYHLKEGRTYVGRDDAESEQDIVLHGLDLESEHCIFENLNGRVTLIPLNGAQCSVNGVQILESTQLNQGAVILLGRTNMFRFNHPKEAAKLREKRKSGLLSSFSLSMTDLSKSCENLSAVMLYNPGLEFERQQREELEKLENKRKMIKEMEEKQRSEKAELEKMQQEVESQRKETEFVQLQIRKQEESLKRRSMDIETRLKDLLDKKEKFEEERLREQHEIKLQKKKQEEESFAKVQQELQRLQELHSTEKAEKIEIFKELEKLKKEKDDQYLKLELEKRRLEEQEREQLKLVFRLEEQLREKQEMIQLLKREDFLRLEDEIQVLEDVREDLLRAKESRSEGEEDPDEVEKATNKYTTFKKVQLEKLSSLVDELNQQKEGLEHEIIADRDTLGRLNLSHIDDNRGDDCSLTSTPVSDERDMVKQTEHRLHCKERQLQYINQNHLPALVEEKQRASEILDSGLLGLDKTLYQIEKEIEEKADQLAQFRASSDQLQQLQATFEFTANIARQEEKVRKKEKEIIESREKQHREALEQAVAKLERRHSALQRHSTIDVEIEEQKRKLTEMDSCQEHASLQATLEAEQRALEQDRERLSQEIQQLKQKIQVTDPLSKTLSGALEEMPSFANSPASPVKSQSQLLQLTDDRIHAYIEEEVQRRLQNINLPSEVISSLSMSYSSESEKGPDSFLNGINQRKMKYEKVQHPLANRRKLSVPQIGAVSSPPTRMVLHERQNLNPVTANLYSLFTQKCSDSQEKHLKEENKKGKNRSSISEYFDFLFDREHEPSHLLSSNLSHSKCAHQNISSASQQIPPKTKGKHLESVSGDRDFFKMEPDRTLFQEMSSSKMKALDNEQPECNDISYCNLPETNMFPENDLKENKCFCPTHQGILLQPHVYQCDCDQSSDSPLCQDSTHYKYSLQNLFTKFSYLYKERQLPTLQNVIKQAKTICSVQVNSVQNLPGLSRIKDLQFVNYFQSAQSNKKGESEVLHPYENKVKVYNIVPTNTKSTDGEKLMLVEFSPGKENAVGGGHHVSKFEDDETDNVNFLASTFLKFPNKLLELRNCRPVEIIDHFLATVPNLCIKKNECRYVYWLSVGNKSHPEPRLACLLLSKSNLSFIIFSGTESMFLFTLPVRSLEELHISFGGQSLQLLGSFEDSPVTIFTFDNSCTLQLCQVLTKMQVTDSEYAKYCSHPLLSRDLMELSTDWNADLSDLVFTNGFKVTCTFKSALADVAYLLHENTNGTKPALGDMHLLLYTSVKVDHMNGQCVYMSLALTNVSIALVLDGVFQANLDVKSPSSSRFDQIKLHSLSDVKCIVLTDQEDSTKIAIVFSSTDKKSTIEMNENELLSVISQSDLKENVSLTIDVWRLTLSSYKHALFLIRHLTFLQ